MTDAETSSGEKAWAPGWPAGVRWALALPLLALLTAHGAGGAEVRLTTANDFFTFNSIDDSLYTAAWELELDAGRYRLHFLENMFTDPRGEFRFDETTLTASRGFGLRDGWLLEVEAGVLYLGKGLFGEDFQNALHRVIGDEEVRLPYLDDSGFHTLLGVAARKEVSLSPRLLLIPHLEAAGAVGFRHHAAAGVSLAWRGEGLLSSVLLDLGGRYSATELEALRPYLARLGPTWEVRFGIRDRFTVSWNFNHYGTASQHFVVDYRWKLGAARRGAS